MDKNHFPASRFIDFFNPMFDPSLPDPLKVTLLQLMALCWGSPAHQTPPLSYAHLEELMGKPSRTIRGHIAALRDHHAALDYRRADVGQFIIVLAERFFRSTAAGPGDSPPVPPRPGVMPGRKPPKFHKMCRVSPASFNEEEENRFGDTEKNPLLKKDIGQKNGSAGRPHWPPRKNHRREPAAPAALTETFTGQLLEAGVFRSLLGEVAASGYSETDLTALLAWCQAEQPAKAAPLFIGRLRNGARAPERFRVAPCPVCGQRGGHAEGCYKKYA
jgi:hypothetical protein